MLRDITLGQFYPADSVLHKLDPRTKFLGTMAFIISVFVFNTFPGYACLLYTSDAADEL